MQTLEMLPRQNQGDQLTHPEHHTSHGRWNPNETHSQLSSQQLQQLPQQPYPTLHQHQQQLLQLQAGREIQRRHQQQPQRQQAQVNPGFLQYQPKTQQEGRLLPAVPQSQSTNVQRYPNGQPPGQLPLRWNTHGAFPNSQGTVQSRKWYNSFSCLDLILIEGSDTMHPSPPGGTTSVSTGRNVPFSVHPIQGPTVNNQAISGSQKQMITQMRALSALGQKFTYPHQRQLHQNRQPYYSNEALAGAIQQVSYITSSICMIMMNSTGTCTCTCFKCLKYGRSHSI